MGFHSKVLKPKLNGRNLKKSTKSGLCQTNTPYSLEGYGVSSTCSHLDTYENQYGVSLVTIRRIKIQQSSLQDIICNTPYEDTQYAVSKICQDSRRIQDIKRGPYSKSYIDMAY